MSASALAFDASRPRRMGPLALIALVHAGGIWMLANGLMSRVSMALPPAMTVYINAHLPEQHATPHDLSPPKVKMIVPPVTIVELPPNVIASSVASPAAAQTAPMQATSPETSAVPLPRTITTGVEYVKAPRPEYPPLSRRMKEEGKVVLRVLVDEDGHPQQVDIHKSSGSPRLDEAARKATLSALFKPHMEDGRPVAVYAMVPISFTLS